MRLCVVTLALTAAVYAGTADPVNVGLITDEAEAALAILERRAARAAVPDSSWSKVFTSKGYALLKARESSMGRAFDDSSFRAFLLSDTLLARVGGLRTAVASWRGMNVAAPARRALAYLPAGATIRANLVPLIKPLTNSFVFFEDSTPAMMLYVDPAQTAAQLENTLAHELHHIGYATSCRAAPRSDRSRAVRTARLYAGAFGEGLAMLAAAGGPTVHPHAASDTADRNRWDRDVARVGQDLEAVQRFLQDVAEERLVGDDSIRTVAMGFFGVQGPWYTVGWRMAATIEEELGRERLVSVICDPVRMLATYNIAARQRNARMGGSVPLPLWSPALLRRLGEPG